MANKYLDLTGLSYLWGKIKAKITADISTHNSNTSAHSDIRTALNGKAAASHNHNASQITEGTMAVERGGTGASTAAAARTSLGAASAATLKGYEDAGQLGGSKSVITTGEDVDDYIEPGIYSFANAYTPAHFPTGVTNGWLIVLTWGKANDTVKQILLRHGNTASNQVAEVYVRQRASNSPWGEWYKNASATTVTTASVG